MRFKLTLQIQPEVMGRELPINYQYPLQGVIYHTLEKSDLHYSTWLHLPPQRTGSHGLPLAYCSTL